MGGYKWCFAALLVGAQLVFEYIAMRSTPQEMLDVVEVPDAAAADDDGDAGAADANAAGEGAGVAGADAAAGADADAAGEDDADAAGEDDDDAVDDDGEDSGTDAAARALGDDAEDAAAGADAAADPATAFEGVWEGLREESEPKTWGTLGREDKLVKFSYDDTAEKPLTATRMPLPDPSKGKALEYHLRCWSAKQCNDEQPGNDYYLARSKPKEGSNDELTALFKAAKWDTCCYFTTRSYTQDGKTTAQLSLRVFQNADGLFAQEKLTCTRLKGPAREACQAKYVPETQGTKWMKLEHVQQSAV